MSAVTSRPSVISVSGTAAAAALTGGAVLAASLISSLLRGLGSAVREAHRAYARPPEALWPVAALRDEHHARHREAAVRLTSSGLSPVEAARVALLSGIAETPFVVAPNVSVEADLRAVRAAATVAEVERAGRVLLSRLEAAHQQVFTGALVVACSNASLKTGFGSVETAPGVAGGVRVIATDPAGRALVTEISGGEDAQSIRTEVVGVSDGSCQRILDAFDKALEEEGVRADAPRRAVTGGVCELEAAQDFVRRKLKPRGAAAPPQAAAPAGEKATRRRTRAGAAGHNKGR